MKVEQILSKLYSLGIKISVVDDKLKIQATKDKIPNDIVELIKANKDELTCFLSESGERNYLFKINSLEKKECRKLSSSQKRLYLLQQIDIESTAYNLPYFIALGEDVNKEKIECIFKELINRHESLRTSFEIRDNEIIQRIHESIDFDLNFFKTEKKKLDYFKNQFIQAFDLSEAPLLRVMLLHIKNEGYLLMIDMHHIICDGISHSILEKEFNLLYYGEKLDPLRLQYTDYCDWQNSPDQQKFIKKQEEYWLSKYSDEVPILNLPIDYPRPTKQNFEGARVIFTLSKNETEIIKEIAENSELTLYMILLSVYAILLSKLSGQNDIIIGTPVSGRNHTDLEQVVGMFVNTLALRLKLDRESTLEEIFTSIKQTTLNSFNNKDYQFEDLVEKLSIERDTSRNPIFDVMFNLLNYVEHSGKLTEQHNAKNIHLSSISKFDLTLTAIDYKDQIQLTFEYCTKLFNEKTINKYINYFKQLINNLPNFLNKNLSTIELITEEEKDQILNVFNNTYVDFQRNKTVHQLFEERVVESPDDIALILNDRKLTYEELNEKSNQLCKLLSSKGVGRGNIVCILMDRSIEMIIGIISILKSGAAYCPIDVNIPNERKRFIISDTGANLLLTKTNLLSDLKLKCEVLRVDDYQSIIGCNENINANIQPSDLAYLIYTSGTTGKPKGVLIGHDGVVNHICWYAKRYDLNKRTKLPLLSNYSFDASVSQIFGTLISGGTLYMINENLMLNIEALYSYLNNEGITIINTVPVVLEELIVNREKILTLQRIISGGESLNNQLKEKIRKLGYELYNHYGPTEGTVIILSEKCSDKIVTLGKPKQNTQSYILSETYDQLKPVGVYGELCISGYGISKGYLNNPELTHEKFIEHPFNKGERLYKTGDLARWLTDGNIEFGGRLDNQVKIRGFRIELQEIENILQKNSNVKQCSVVSYGEGTNKYLCAYVVVENIYNEQELRSFLGQQLPYYMIPDYFSEIKELPLTTSGKIDFRRLSKPEITASENYIAPRNNTEIQLVKIWSDILGIPKEKISINSSFLSLGGNSIKAVMLSSTISKELKVDVSIQEIYNSFDINNLSLLINSKNKLSTDEITVAEKREYYELSYNQKRIWFLDQFNQKTDAYNIGGAITLDYFNTIDDIYKAIYLLIKSNVSLRLGFKAIDGDLIQFIYPIEKINTDQLIIDLRDDNYYNEKIIEINNHRFDLSNPPLVKFIIYKGENNEIILSIIMHHIITDGWSMSLLKKEFEKYYSQSINITNTKQLDYIDYVYWQSSYINKRTEISKSFWTEEISKPVGIVNLPKDYINKKDNITGSIYSFKLGVDKLNKIELLKKELNCSVFAILFSSYLYLLYKITGNRNISSYIINSGRDNHSTLSIIGLFVNALLFNTEIDKKQTYKLFIKKVQDKIFQILEHQHYPLEKLFAEKRIKFPDIPVSFNMLNHTGQTINTDSDFSNLKGYKQDVKFELELYVREFKDAIVFQFAYNDSLYSQRTIEYLSDNYLDIIDSILESREFSFSDFLDSKKKLKIF